MTSIPALVEPELLAWARKSANLEPLAAERKIGIPEGRVAEWESGNVHPTIAQLRSAARVYNRALAVFFLPEPPRDFDSLRDFRRLSEATSGEWSLALHAEYRRAHFQREALLDIAEREGELPSTTWRLDIEGLADRELAARARTLLQASTNLRKPTSKTDEYKHLNYWTNALEEAGVLVMTTEGGEVSTEEMRAFSLYFEEIPVVVLNGKDATRGRTFSLLHEYAHLLLHSEGLCDATTDARAIAPNRKLEARCNALAAEILMPADLILATPEVANHEGAWMLCELIEYARPYGVSAEAFLRRLTTLGLVELAAYQEFREKQWNEGGSAAEAESTSSEGRSSKKGGGSFYRTKARNLGKGYIRQVTGAHRRRSLDSSTAATYLGVKVGQMERLAEVADL